MEKSIPAGARILLAFIYRTETGRDFPECYEVIYGHNEDKLPKKLTSMTLDEVEAAQPSWTKRFGSSAAGAAQFMRNTLDAPRTLRDIEGEMGLTGKERFDGDLQDRMAFHLLKRRGYNEFMNGTLSATAFGNRLAMEWASFPVLSPSLKGAHRTVKRGQSYYVGDGVNKSLTKPETVEGVLASALSAGQDIPVDETPITIPTSTLPERKPATKPSWIAFAVIAALAILVFLSTWFFGQPASEVSTNLIIPGIDAPTPMDRPVGFLSNGGGGNELWGQITMAILLSFVGPLVSAAATGVVGWITYLWARVLKTDFDQKSADQLHAALERGILAGIQALGARAAPARLLDAAADYTQQWNAGTVKKFKLSREQLRELAAPHLTAVKLVEKG